MATIVVVAQHVRPVFAGRAPVVQRVLAAEVPIDWRDSVLATAPWLSAAPTDSTVLKTAQYEADRQAFKSDLLATGRVTQARAELLATVAVREAYIRRVPPALVLGVMLAENATFKSRASSNVGAVGLMQVYPKYWVPTLGRRFGKNLRNDETNLQYGVFILSHFIRSVHDSVDAPRQWRVGLLRYNGCVRGTNTPGCSRYPDKVRQHVERSARAMCGSDGFERCVARPLELSVAMREDAAERAAADRGASERATR